LFDWTTLCVPHKRLEQRLVPEFVKWIRAVSLFINKPTTRLSLREVFRSSLREVFRSCACVLNGDRGQTRSVWFEEKVLVEHASSGCLLELTVVGVRIAIPQEFSGVEYVIRNYNGVVTVSSKPLSLLTRRNCFYFFC